MTAGPVETPTPHQHTTMTKAFAVALAALGGGLGIGLLGAKAAEATGRKVLVISIILAALIEGIFILTAFAVPF